MTDEDLKCSSCGIRLIGTGVVSFLCPSCGETRIGRCAQCRDQGVRYTCVSCGFSGP
ncbi:MAG: zinc finger domain-containing protein [Candidatus Thermoplasmatota archaeon]|nr:zinc finger domain-containing protein [Candidatus Thermoplasmatota archaeon]MCL5437150.1 zinc finger domain-containing protein [Candidatus Thermoplasmatota archaeon]